MAPATLKQVTEYFGIKLSEFKNEWAALTDEDREQIKEGIGNGTETY